MTLLVALPAAPTTPGVEVASPDGRLVAVLHAGFPGVLLRVRDSGRESTVWRGDGAEWAAVRSGAPVTLSQGEGFAYDAEVAPGVAYVFVLDKDDPASALAVRVPGWADADWSAWLVPAANPGLSRKVAIRSAPAAFTIGGTESLSAIRGSYATGTYDVGPRLARTWSMTLIAYSLSERDAILDLLSAGPCVFHPNPACESPISDGWLMPGSTSVEQVGRAPRWAHLVTVSLTQTARPWPGDAPLRIPGWDWATSTTGLTDAAAYATAYPTTWAQLKAGIGGWSQ